MYIYTPPHGEDRSRLMRDQELERTDRVSEPLAAYAAEELLTLEEACRFLKVKPSWIYRQTSEGKLPHLKVGKYLRFVKAELVEWFRNNGARDHR